MKSGRAQESGSGNGHNPEASASGQRLNSWKEIAAYLGRDVRTVQRWESDQSLPVRRLKHSERSTVYATVQDLDSWLAGRTEGEASEKVPLSGLRRSWLVAAGVVLGCLSLATYWLNASRMGPTPEERPPLEAANVPPAETRLLVLADEPNKCLHKELYHWQNGIRIHLWDCEVNRPDNNLNKYWFYEQDSGLIRAAFNTAKCIVQAEPDQESDKPIVLWDCEGAPDERKQWTFDETTGQIRARRTPAYCLEEDMETDKRTQEGKGRIVRMGLCETATANASWRFVDPFGDG